MPFKLTKVLSSIIALMLVLLQVDQSMALREDLKHNRIKTLTLLDNSEQASGTLSTQDQIQESNWEQIFPLQSPDPRIFHGMAYDSNQNAMVIFGGDPDGKGHDRLDETWAYESGTWNQVSPKQSPPGRVNINNAMIYDPTRGVTVLFGGLSETGYMNDTWEYYQDGAIHVWEPITPTVKPMVRDTHAMAYDSTRQVTVMFGGWSLDEPGKFLQDTWEYDGNDWDNITTEISPTARHQHALAFDSQRNVVVLFGGRYMTSALNDTWEYDGSNWYQVTTANSPSPRSSHGMAYDPDRKVVVLYGGQDGNQDPVEDDTWEYDGTNWVQVETVAAPIDRYGTPLVYDNQREKMVFFGGGIKNGSLKTSDETWEYSQGANNHKIYLPMLIK